MEKLARDDARNPPKSKANDPKNMAEPTGFRKNFAESLTAPATAFRDIAELDDLAHELGVRFSKSQNYFATAYQKFLESEAIPAHRRAEYADLVDLITVYDKKGGNHRNTAEQLFQGAKVALEAGEYGPEWTARKWLRKKVVGLSNEEIRFLVPKPRRRRARQSTHTSVPGEKRDGLDSKERRMPAPAPVPVDEKLARIEFQREFERFTRVLQSKQYIDPLPRAERIEAATRFASLLGVAIPIVESDEPAPPPATSSAPRAQEPPPAPTPASEPSQATVAPRRRAAWDHLKGPAARSPGWSRRW